MKALNTSNETVLALGANFSHSADSHLVAMQVEAFTIFLHFVLFDIRCGEYYVLSVYSIGLAQGEDGSYQTQAINIQNKERMVTGARYR